MIPVDRCILCDGKKLEFAPATVAPFLAHRCGMPLPLPAVRSAWCPECDFTFFDHRLDPEETLKLYDGYRDGRYNDERQRFEPYYSIIQQQYEDHANDYHRVRIANLKDLFASKAHKLRHILDYGGEADGWLAKGAFPEAEVQVYDISFDTAEPLPHSQDLVICCGVFEHLSFPMDLLHKLVGYLKPGGMLYLEIPIDYSGGLSENLAKAAGILHEHLSDFSPRALERMLNRAGLLSIGRGSTFGSALGIIAKRPVWTSWPRLRERLWPGSLPSRSSGEPIPAGEDPMLNGAVIQGVNAQVDRWVEKGTKVVVVPAGRFTRGLLERTRINETRLLALCDKSPLMQGQKLHGRPIRPYEDIEALAPEVILVASPFWEREICASLEFHRAKGIQVLPLSSLVWP